MSNFSGSFLIVLECILLGYRRKRLCAHNNIAWHGMAYYSSEVRRRGRERDVPNRAWAVQMLEVALSLRMCCSLVCIAILRAGLPLESTDTPMMRPGILRELRRNKREKIKCERECVCVCL